MPDLTEQLTPKRLAFCNAVADGMSASDAYRTAYNADGMAPATIHRKAADLMADGKIRARITQLRETLADVAIWTRADSVRVLAEVALKAEDKPSARVAAVVALNKLLGLDQAHDETDTKRPVVIEIVAPDVAV